MPQLFFWGKGEKKKKGKHIFTADHDYTMGKKINFIIQIYSDPVHLLLE